MNRASAIRQIGKLLGSSFRYRINDKAPTPEERVAAKTEMTAVAKIVADLKAKKEARYEEILKEDAEYQQLYSAWKAERDRHCRLQSMQYSYRITVGKVSSLFFHVMAEGDTWDEVVEKLTKKQAA